MKNVLVVAYHFPPFAASSGVQRALSFARYLPENGWRPIVLTVRPGAYEAVAEGAMPSWPEEVIVARAPAADAARHLSIMGRYPQAFAIPDRWASWWLGGLVTGLRLVARHRPAAIVSTYPIATAHKLAGTLARLTGLPWIADFRDPMAQDGYPADPRVWQAFRRIEEIAITRAARVTVVAPGALSMYAERYPAHAKKLVLLGNGFDEQAFADAEATLGSPKPLIPGAITLLHSGVVYPSERDPTQLMEAIALLARTGRIDPGRVRFRFRSTSHDDHVRGLARSSGVEAFIELLPSVPYSEALGEMMSADGLLVLQASNCNAQVPAKLYEYIRARRPILGLTDPVGDTAGVLSRSGYRHIARLDSAPDIAEAIEAFLADLRAGSAPIASAELAAPFSRRGVVRTLATHLDEISA